MRYLIVEDDPNLRLLWQSVFSDRGYEVTLADSVEAARAALRTTPFDVMVLDLYLGRENGLSLASLAAENGSGCKVIIVTGASDLQEKQVRAASDAIVSVHRKPVDIEDLLEVSLRLEDRGAKRASL